MTSMLWMCTVVVVTVMVKVKVDEYRSRINELYMWLIGQSRQVPCMPMMTTTYYGMIYIVT